MACNHIIPFPLLFLSDKRGVVTALAMPLKIGLVAVSGVGMNGRDVGSALYNGTNYVDAECL